MYCKVFMFKESVIRNRQCVQNGWWGIVLIVSLKDESTERVIVRCSEYYESPISFVNMPFEYYSCFCTFSR